MFSRPPCFRLSLILAVVGVWLVAAGHGWAAEPEDAMLPALKLNDDLFKSLKASNQRDWAPEVAVLALAEIRGDRATVRNIRDCRWRRHDDFTPAYYDQTFDLKALRSLDLIFVPLASSPELGRAMLSFGFEGDEHLAVSVEPRRERGEAFSPIRGVLQQYELAYVVASERDLIGRRVQVDRSEVFLYRTTALPREVRKVFLEVMSRVNKLGRTPEFYDTMTNNSETNIRRHLEGLLPERKSYDVRQWFAGDLDRQTYDLGLIARRGSFDQTRLESRVNYPAYLHRDDPMFSRAIRR